jgi:acyl carrier protein
MSHSFDDVLQHIVAFLHEKLEGDATPEITAGSHFTKDLNVGSLLIFSIVENLEETYGIVVPLQLLYQQKVQTVGDLAQEVTRLANEA